MGDSRQVEILGASGTTSPTGTAGATVVGASAPWVGGQTALVEILAAGTITEDASSPASASTTAAASVVTASFTPPPGSLLVAIVSADASSATVVTVSDSSGLIWTERVHSLAGGSQTGYAGMWTAQVPAIGGPLPQAGSSQGRRQHRRQQQMSPPSGRAADAPRASEARTGSRVSAGSA